MSDNACGKSNSFLQNEICKINQGLDNFLVFWVAVI